MRTGIRPVVVGCTLLLVIQLAAVSFIAGFRPSALQQELIMACLVDAGGVALGAGLQALVRRRRALRPEARQQPPSALAEPGEGLSWTGPYAPPEHDRVQLRIGEDRQIMEWEQLARPEAAQEA